MGTTHGQFSRLFVLNPATPLTNGGTFDLGKGQVGLFKNKSGARGAIATGNLTNSKGELFFLEVGTGIKGNDAGLTTKGLRTSLFTPKDVLAINYEEAKEPTLAEVYLGYDGLDLTKTLNLKKGEAAEISLQLIGAPLAYYGYQNGIYNAAFTISVDEAEDCEDGCEPVGCKERTLALIEQIKNRKIREGVKLSDIIDVHPVFSCEVNPAGTDTVTFYSLTVCDNGDDAALGLIQAQTPGYKVVRVGRSGANSTYQVVGADAPSDYVVWEANLKTNCEGACPDGYTLVEGGLVYSIALDDEGADLSGDIEAVGLNPNTIVVVKVGQSYNVGKYNLIVDGALSAGDIEDLIGAFPTIKVDETPATATDACVKDELDEVVWVVGKECDVTTAQYYIDLNDDVCGNSRLAELQAAYPSLNIYILGAVSTVTTPVAGTYTGADGTYNGVSGTGGSGTGATFNVVITGENSAAITVVNGGTGYKVGDNITISDSALGGEGNAPLVIAITGVANGTAGDCRQRYFTDVVSNYVCDECHPDLFATTAPDAFEFEEWKKVVAAEADGDCSCGIMFRGKKLDLCPPKEIADKVGTINKQVEIQVSGGELLGTKIGYKYNQVPFPVTRVSRAFDGTGWGADYWEQEKMSFDYGASLLVGNSYEERWFKGATPILETCEQYDTITLKVKRSYPSQGFSRVQDEYFNYIFVIPQGSKALFAPFFNAVIAGNPEANSI